MIYLPHNSVWGQLLAGLPQTFKATNPVIRASRAALDKIDIFWSTARSNGVGKHGSKITTLLQLHGWVATITWDGIMKLRGC
jgi:hypothetical protein